MGFGGVYYLLFSALRLSGFHSLCVTSRSSNVIGGSIVMLVLQIINILESVVPAVSSGTPKNLTEPLHPCWSKSFVQGGNHCVFICIFILKLGDFSLGRHNACLSGATIGLKFLDIFLITQSSDNASRKFNLHLSISTFAFCSVTNMRSIGGRLEDLSIFFKRTRTWGWVGGTQWLKTRLWYICYVTDQWTQLGQVPIRGPWLTYFKFLQSQRNQLL